MTIKKYKVRVFLTGGSNFYLLTHDESEKAAQAMVKKIIELMADVTNIFTLERNGDPNVAFRIESIQGAYVCVEDNEEEEATKRLNREILEGHAQHYRNLNRGDKWKGNGGDDE